MKDPAPANATARPQRALSRLRQRMLKYLDDGATPEMLALAVALGAACGLFPIYGLTTAVSFLAGLAFRAHPVVVQLANYLMYPIYFPVALGFIVSGEWIFGGGQDEWTLAGLRALLSEGPKAALAHLGLALVYAVVVWAALAPVLVWVLRIVLFPVIRRWRNGLP